jgi:hypothetical protein
MVAAGMAWETVETAGILEIAAIRPGWLELAVAAADQRIQGTATTVAEEGEVEMTDIACFGDSGLGSDFGSNAAG